MDTHVHVCVCARACACVACAAGQDLTSVRFDDTGLHVAVGTRNGLVALYDLRSQVGAGVPPPHTHTHTRTHTHTHTPLHMLTEEGKAVLCLLTAEFCTSCTSPGLGACVRY